MQAPLASFVRQRFVWLAPTDSLRQAESTMRMARLRAVPVVGDGELLGMLSYWAVASCWLGCGEAPAPRAGGDAAQVASLMDTKPVAISAGLPLETAVAHLLRSGDGCVPVVDADGKRLLGVVTEADLLRALLASPFRD